MFFAFIAIEKNKNKIAACFFEKEMSSILADQCRPRFMSPNAGEEGGSCGVSAH